MFTGIVNGKGKVIAFERGRLELEVPAAYRRLKIGASVAVNGTCLTVVRRKGKTLSFDVVRETLRRTALGLLRKGDAVNLERALRHGDPIDGHFVLGHVDAAGKAAKLSKKGTQTSVFIIPPRKLLKHCIEKGSITVDGVSLTVGRVERGGFWIHLIPHTLRKTTLGALRRLQKVNLETDMALKSRR